MMAQHTNAEDDTQGMSSGVPTARIGHGGKKGEKTPGGVCVHAVTHGGVRRPAPSAYTAGSGDPRRALTRRATIPCEAGPPYRRELLLSAENETVKSPECKGEQSYSGREKMPPFGSHQVNEQCPRSVLRLVRPLKPFCG